VLRVVHSATDPGWTQNDLKLALVHHNQLLQGYYQSQIIRNHSPNTREATKRHLESWFKSQGTSERPLLIWEAMRPMDGRKLIIEYGKTLIQAELANHTIRKYLGNLKNFFQYVIEHPVVHGENGKSKRLIALYGPIEQPVSEYDIPQHTYDACDGPNGVPLDPEKLREFYSIIRKHYLGTNGHVHIRARNYAMIVMAGETGLRADELRHLEIQRDLFFDSKKVQTRFAKSTKGSGKRTRLTLFTPLARDTIRYYLRVHRPQIASGKSGDFLFPSQETAGPIVYNQMMLFLQEMVALANKKGFPIADHFTWHWFRRIFATRFIETFPTDLPTLISLLGHTSLGTVHRYIHHSQAWSDKKIQGVIERIENDEY
jgi:site-specific recombinase XerD